MKIDYKKIFITAGIVCLFFTPKFAKAANAGDIVNFNVDKGFDASGRTQLSAVLIEATPRLYFYVEKSWWDLQSQDKQNQILSDLYNLSDEFGNNIYPKLTSTFGYEWNPGIDGDSKITVLFEQMNSTEGGYFRENDEYDKLQLPDSNQREMVYLSILNIDNPGLKVVLGHEFTHLITFNQKNKSFGVEEDTWLNEARADYSATILGYNNPYQGSNLQQRVKDFVESPSDSLTDWSGTKYDYASAALFTQYLVDQYGAGILGDSLRSKFTGIQSINYTLQKNGISDDFNKAFSNWTVATVLNNCSIGKNYCYTDDNLKNFKLSPSLNFLPLTGNVSLSVINATKNWQGNWLKFIGGNGDLKLDFSSLKGLNFQVPYIVEDSAGSYAVKSLSLDKNEKGEISLSKFGTDFKSLIIIPSLRSDVYSDDNSGMSYPFTYAISITGNQPVGDEALMQKLLDQIVYLKAQIAKLQGGSNISGSCSQLTRNLSRGMRGDDVKCLQQFLRDEDSDIYPQGLITGNFGNLTAQAVIKFQERYSSDILAPFGLSKGTGYVGENTREKVNQILSGE